MSYRLIGSLTSPYSRKLRMLMHERVPFEFQVIDYMQEKDGAYLREINPINKIPLLLDGTQKIFDSRVIFNYLRAKHDWRALSLDEENVLSAIEAANDSCVNLFMLRRGGLDLSSSNFYLERQKERVPQILQFLSPWIKGLNPSRDTDWYFPAMSLYSFLYWGQFRNMVDLGDFPEARAFLESFAQKPGVESTDIPASFR